MPVKERTGQPVESLAQSGYNNNPQDPFLFPFSNVQQKTVDIT